MKKILCMLSLLLCQQVAWAQLIPPKPVFHAAWYHGVLIDQQKQVLRGQIRLNHEDNAVLLRKDSTITAYSPQQVLFIQYYDDELQVNREFTTLPNHNNPRKTMFYEVVLKGDIVLLRREVMVNEPTRVHQGNEVRTIFTPAMKHEYFLYNHKEVRFLTSFNRDLRPLVNNRWGDVAAFIESEQLSMATLEDQIDIIHFYNNLSQ